MNRRKSNKIKHDADNLFTYLSDLDDHLRKDNSFVCAMECSNVFTDSFGVLSIISYDEIINIKFKLDKTQQQPLEFDKLSRFKDVYGSKFVKSKGTIYVLMRNGKIHQFKSLKSIDTVDELVMECVYYFESFGDDAEKFIAITENSSKIVLKVYELGFTKIKEFDLMCSEDTLKALRKENNISSFAREILFNVEYLINRNDSEDKIDNFFNAFFNCNLTEESVDEILLVSMNDRLMWIKNEEEIQTKLIAKGKILSIRYWNGGLMIIDENFMLTIFYYCNDTRIIKKNEIPLVGGVRCFRFYQEYLIYSAKYKMVIMKFISPSMEPETCEISLGMITTFTIIHDHDFLIAIDVNNFFYYVPIMQSRYIYDRSDKNDFFELSRDEIIKLPESIKYLEEQEKELKKLSEEFEREMDLKILFDHLDENDDFVGGNAIVEYLPCLLQVEAHDIVCKRTNNNSNGSYIKISLFLQSLLSPFSFSIVCYRHSKDYGVNVRDIEIPKPHENHFSIFIPTERSDNSQNRIEIFVHFKTEETVLEFPVLIERIDVNENYKEVNNDVMDECIKEIEKLMKSNNI